MRPRPAPHRLIGRWAVVVALWVCATVTPVWAQRIGGGGDDGNDEARQKAAAQAKAGKYFAEGQALMDKGEVARAKSKFKAAIGLVGLEGVGQSAWSQLVAIHNQGMQELDRAQSLFKEEKYVEALDVAKRTMSIYANIFSGLKVPSNHPIVSRQAKSLIEAIERHPQAQIAIQEHGAQKRVKRIASLERRARKDSSLYYDLYKAHMALAKQFPDCPTGKASAAEAARLSADKKVGKAIRREQSRREIAAALGRIEEHEKAGRMGEAERELKSLMSRYPGKSRAELKEMSVRKPPKKPDKKGD